ncbi:amidohydrolase [Vagococcus lutrae]|uniref:amidohydrolase n=1 Tax=Vagococcus lutrae TaxID=81947 RepID=UPI00200CDC16|nr:amidohydrolase [Vagococcus lutrae]UQF23269.1 amidohydrolase [Vagococcus lutrae]UQF65100.1 amidohydrolase [Vagococcus lutrae]
MKGETIMTIQHTTLMTALEELEPQIIEWRRYLHQHPEPSLKEYQTKEWIQQKLTQQDIPFVSVGETGTLATIKGAQDNGKTILLRADIDALELPDETGTLYASQHEGLNHACGHDGHTASLLATAFVLNDYREAFSGTVLIAFQQAEEIGAGARKFVESGLLGEVDEVFGIHLDSSVPVGKLLAVPGPTNASCDIFKIKVKGVSGHAARPDLGRDALLSAASIVVELQKIVAREINPLESVVVAVGVLDAGTRYNIVANTAVIEGTVRAFSHENRQHAVEAVERIARQVASAHRTEIEFEVYDAAAPLINDAVSAERAAKVASDIVGAENVITNQLPSLGADDFADFLAIAPGVYGRVGTRHAENEKTHYAHHHEKFDIDERSLLLASQYHLHYALTYLKEK